MSHKKNVDIWRHGFNLESGNDEQKRLHEHLVEQALSGKASQWMIETLIAALPAQPVEHLRKAGILSPEFQSPDGKIEYGYPVPDEESPSPDDEITYEDVD